MDNLIDSVGEEINQITRYRGCYKEDTLTQDGAHFHPP
jgi:hypothetical protein